MSLTDVLYDAFNALQRQGISKRRLGNLELQFVSSYVRDRKGYDLDDRTINLLWRSHINLFRPLLGAGTGVGDGTAQPLSPRP